MNHKNKISNTFKLTEIGLFSEEWKKVRLEEEILSLLKTTTIFLLRGMWP